MVVTSADTSPVVTTESGTELRVLMDTREEGQGRMSLAMETLMPGQHTFPHWHTHVEEVYYIIKGQGRMEVGDEARQVHSGDTILIPIDEVHCLHNIGDDDLILLCLVSPPWCSGDHHAVKENHQ